MAAYDASEGGEGELPQGAKDQLQLVWDDVLNN